jgi:ribosomal protein L11 methyltransferase
VATANALANGVGERVHVSNTPLAAVEGTFDVVVANLLAPALLTLADDLVRTVAPGGALVISGILTARHDHVVAALAPLQPVERRTREGWTAITLRS